MWGDPERAATFDGNDPLALLLYQVASPAHMPWNDTRWNELLHGYDVWVHLEEEEDSDNNSSSGGGGDGDDSDDHNNNNNNKIISGICRSMAKHAANSSNLATLSLHVTKMVRDLSHDIHKMTMSTTTTKATTATTTTTQSEAIDSANDDGDTETSTSQQHQQQQHPASDIADFSTRISLVGKARATAGALKLLRLLCHPVIVQSCRRRRSLQQQQDEQEEDSSMLQDAFTYRTRGDLPSNQPAGVPLLNALLDFIVVVGQSDTLRSSSSSTSSSSSSPEVYDATVFAIQLLLVLCSTQLYQPFQSSFEKQQQQQQQNQQQNGFDSSSSNYILEELFHYTTGDEDHYDNETSRRRDRNSNRQSNSNNNYLHLLWSSDRSFASQGSNNSRNSKQQQRNGRTSQQKRPHQHQRIKRTLWTPRQILEICLEWQIHRPQAPVRSISYMYYVLAQNAAIATSTTEKPGPDGMYETYMIVQAVQPTLEIATSTATNDNANGTNTGNGTLAVTNSTTANGGDRSLTTTTRHHHHHHRGSLILDATKGVLTISGSIFLLPFRLMSLVFGVLKHTGGSGGRKNGTQLTQEAVMRKFASASESNRTRDVLWLTDSILADLSCSLFLLLSNNNRNLDDDAASTTTKESSKTNQQQQQRNLFRSELHGLTDNRWEGELTSDLPDLPNFNSLDSINNASFTMTAESSISGIVDGGQRRSWAAIGAPSSPYGLEESNDPLSLNFELLFDAFGRTLHTEVGALSLYTLLQASPAFAESLAVRSDLDTLVLPLLRTLYFSSRSNTYMARDYASSSSKASTNDPTKFDIRSFPFRSQSQLYVIVILLLIFSQDTSFGRDAFQRITVPNVIWYKERNLKNINLGSIVLLTLLRMLLFNLNRMKDGFLLSNCCAVLINLSHAISDLHDYASMRLASVAVTVMKKHAKLAAVASKGAGKTNTNGAIVSNQEGDLHENEPSSPLAMHAEAAHTLLELIKQAVAVSSIEGNLHLVYALVYHQVDLIKLCKNTSLYKSREMERISAVTLKASSLIQKEGARSAPKALKVLEMNVKELQTAAQSADESVKSPSKRKKNTTNITMQSTTTEEFIPFTYQEEADPEIFFLPYVWDVIVCVVTASSMEWKKNDIQAFPLLDPVQVLDNDVGGNTNGDTDITAATSEKGFSDEVDGIV